MKTRITFHQRLGSHPRLTRPLLARIGFLLCAWIVLAVLPAQATPITDVCISVIGGATFVTGKTTAPGGSTRAAIVKDSSGRTIGEDVVDDNGKIRVSTSALPAGTTFTIEIKEIGGAGRVLCTSTFTAGDPFSMARFTTTPPILVPSVKTFTAASSVVITGLGPNTVTVPLSGTIQIQFAGTADPSIINGTVLGVELQLPSIDLGMGVQTGPNRVGLKQQTVFTINRNTRATDGDISIYATNSLGKLSFDGTLGGMMDLNTGNWDITGSGDTCALAEEIAPIPTLSQWGLIVLAALLLIVPISIIVRRRNATV